jgi:hypothetical protein
MNLTQTSSVSVTITRRGGENPRSCYCPKISGHLSVGDFVRMDPSATSNDTDCSSIMSKMLFQFRSKNTFGQVINLYNKKNTADADAKDEGDVSIDINLYIKREAFSSSLGRLNSRLTVARMLVQTDLGIEGCPMDGIGGTLMVQPKPQRAAWARVSYSDAAKGVQVQATGTTAASTEKTSTGQSQSSTSNNDSNSSDSNKQDQPEGAILGLSNLKRKLAEIDKDRDLYKIEQTKIKDETSSVTNSLSKLGDKMIQMRQDMMALSGNMRAKLAEMRSILLGMNKKTASPIRKLTGVQKRVKRHHHHPMMRKRQQSQESPLRRMNSHGTVCVSPRLNAIFGLHRQW